MFVYCRDLLNSNSRLERALQQWNCPGSSTHAQRSHPAADLSVFNRGNQNQLREFLFHKWCAISILSNGSIYDLYIYILCNIYIQFKNENQKKQHWKKKT